MAKVIVINRNRVLLIAAFGMLLIAAYMYARSKDVLPAWGEDKQIRIIHLVTGEFKTTTEDGKELEAYRWDPGTLFVKEGETVKLSIRGINGASHPFYIEGTSVQGEVRKGQETVVTFKAEKEGVYRLICLTHPDAARNGPMIGYIVVD